MAHPFILEAQPGVQRDGTQFDAKSFLELLWTRFRLGKPRKMGGFQAIARLNGLPRRVHCWYNGAQIFSHVGTNNGILQVVFDTAGNFISAADRTPVGFLGGPQTGITFDSIFDTTSEIVQLVAHAAPNSGFLSSPIKTTPYIGQIDSPTILAEFGDPGVGPTAGGTWTQPRVSGGIVCVQPFVFDFDSDGLVQWSAPNLPLTLGVVGGTSGAGEARISSQKIIGGIALRGGGSQSPAALLWSMSEVIVATFNGGDTTFSFNTVSPSSSILSNASIIEYDGLYFWAGVDRFMVFNGTVAEVLNNQNQDWFFDNITPGFEGQTWAMKIPRFGEVWWCACMFGSTVPNYAIIFNLRENRWYDTLLPTDTWSAGHFAQGFRRPIVAGQDGNNVFKLWMAETGMDNVDGATRRPIRAFFETPWFGGSKNDPPDDKGLSVQQLEPDFRQTGDLITYVVGAANPRAPESNGPDVPIPMVPANPQETLTSYTPTQNQRLSRLHVESNTLGGSFIAGRNIMRGDPAETTIPT